MLSYYNRGIYDNFIKVGRMSRSVNILKVSRKFHKWLMLFIGLQFIIWSISGAYMVIFDIDYIHGDSLVVTHQREWL